jgi:hypothetical protein
MIGNGPPPPPPPLSRLIREDGGGGFCSTCGSSIAGTWFWQSKDKKCIQPLCSNYYKKDEK